MQSLKNQSAKVVYPILGFDLCKPKKNSKMTFEKLKNTYIQCKNVGDEAYAKQASKTPFSNSGSAEDKADVAFSEKATSILGDWPLGVYVSFPVFLREAQIMGHFRCPTPHKAAESWESCPE